MSPWPKLMLMRRLRLRLPQKLHAANDAMIFINFAFFFLIDPCKLGRNLFRSTLRRLMVCQEIGQKRLCEEKQCNAMREMNEHNERKPDHRSNNFDFIRSFCFVCYFFLKSSIGIPFIRTVTPADWWGATPDLWLDGITSHRIGSHHSFHFCFHNRCFMLC